MSAHTCHYCKIAPCPPKHLCCAPCWSLVPKALGAKLYAAFDPAQCKGRGPRPLPSGRWMIAADSCLITIGLRKGIRTQAPVRFDLAAVSKLTRAANYAVSASDDMASEDVDGYLVNEIYAVAEYEVPELAALIARVLEYAPWPVDLRERGLLPTPENIAAFKPVL